MTNSLMKIQMFTKFSSIYFMITRCHNQAYRPRIHEKESRNCYYHPLGSGKSSLDYSAINKLKSLCLNMSVPKGSRFFMHVEVLLI